MLVAIKAIRLYHPGGREEAQSKSKTFLGDKKSHFTNGKARQFFALEMSLLAFTSKKKELWETSKVAANGSSMRIIKLLRGTKHLQRKG